MIKWRFWGDMLIGLRWFQYVSVRTQSGRVLVGDLPAVFVKLKAFTEMFTEDEIKAILGESYKDMDEEIDFESYLRVSL